MAVPQKTKNRAAIWPSNLTPGHIPRRNYNLKRYTRLYVHGSTIHNSCDMKTTQMSTGRWTHKEEAHPHTRVHRNTTQPREDWNNVVCSYLDEPRDYHAKQSKSERERQIPYDITYMWNLKFDIKRSLPYWSSGEDSLFPVLGLWLRPLVRELRPHMLHGVAKSKQIKKYPFGGKNLLPC